MDRAVELLSRHGRILMIGVLVLGSANASFAQSACQVAHVSASDGGPFDSFGFSVAIFGDTAVVGADWDDDSGTNSGSAYVFQSDGTTWNQSVKLLAPDGQSGDLFGARVAIYSNSILITAQDDGHGSVYAFQFDGESWVYQQKFFAADVAPGDGFGGSVSIEGNTALIGAPGDDDKGAQSGSAYIFHFEPNTLRWVEDQKLLAFDGSAGDFFGGRVAVSGDVAVIGADGDFNQVGEGAAYVFRFDPKRSLWVEEQKLLPFQGGGAIDFGRAVSVSGDVVLIGGPSDDENGSQSGSAYVFRFDPLASPGSQWVGEQKIFPRDTISGDHFGWSVAIVGETALVGAYGNGEAGPSHGAAYVYRFDGSTWIEEQKVLPEPGPWTAFFGYSVALSGDRAVVGAYGEDVGSGGAYFHAGLSGVDCNANGVSDACDILDGTSQDATGDGVPDECQCPWDINADGSVGINDFLELLANWGPCRAACPWDFNGDGSVAISDFLELLANWGPCA